MESSTLTRRVSPAEGYRRWAAHYDSEANPMLSLEQRFLEQVLPPIKGRDIVDLGCGTGRWLEKLRARSPRSLTGIDPSSEMLSRARNKLGSEAVLLNGRCESAPLEAESADLVLCSFVLSYISDIEVLAARIRQIARPDAHIFITDLHPETESKLGWRRGFRNGSARVDLETHRRSLDSILKAFERQQIQPVAILEPCFGDPEFDILDRAGKSSLSAALRHEPAIYLLHLQRADSSAVRVTASRKPGFIGGLRGARIAFGPEEAASAGLKFQDGRIAFLGSDAAGSALGAHADDVLDLTGFLLLPGLVNAHDHLEFALFPRLGQGGYHNFVEWADDIHRPDTSPVREHRAVPKETRLWWGAIRNLLSGVTTVCHHNPYASAVFDDHFPIRVLRDFGWAHSLRMESDVARKHADTPAEKPFILHLGEGVDISSAQELFALDRMGALTHRTVIVHGLALGNEDFALLKSRGAALIWCPTSNTFLFGRTHSRKALRNLALLALGSDSSLTAAGDLLDELRFAREKIGLAANELFKQVTGNPSRILRLGQGEGSLRAGAVADLIAIRDENRTPAQTLARSTYRDVELVIVSGQVQLASSQLKHRLPADLVQGLEALEIDGRVRWLRAPLKKLFEDARRALGNRLLMNGRLLKHVTK